MLMGEKSNSYPPFCEAYPTGASVVLALVATVPLTWSEVPAGRADAKEAIAARAKDDEVFIMVNVYVYECVPGGERRNGLEAVLNEIPPMSEEE